MPTKNLPRRTRDYLDHGAERGKRNDELLSAACQFRDAGYARHEAERELLPRAEADGLSTAEAISAISSAYGRPARSGITGRTNYVPRRYSAPPPRVFVEPVQAAKNFLHGFDCNESTLQEASPIPLPDDYAQGGAALVSMLYERGEKINVVTGFKLDGDGKARPGDAGVTLTRGEMIARMARGGFKSQAGGWLRMNPLDGAGVADANVTAFRFALIEGDSLPLTLQLPLLCRLPLPIAAILTSGARSLHAWVKVDAKDAGEYRATVGKMLDLLAKLGVDAKNKNPARLSRLPGVVRGIGAVGDGRQRLLYLDPDPQPKRIL